MESVDSDRTTKVVSVLQRLTIATRNETDSLVDDQGLQRAHWRKDEREYDFIRDSDSELML